MRHQRMKLWVAAEQTLHKWGESLKECGIDLLVAQKEEPAEEVDGLLLTRLGDYSRLQELGGNSLRQENSPVLLLVFGDEAPYGWADELAAACEASQKPYEVVRMSLWSGKERVLLGGGPVGQQMRRLCRLLADHGKLSMVCGRREVDEAIRQLPRYLAWKERFYWEMGEACDDNGVSLKQVSRALGLDTRVGQGWLDPVHQDHSLVCAWLVRECQHVLQKTKIERIALIGPADLWNKMPQGWLADKAVAVYTGTDEPFPNEARPGWVRCDSWKAAAQEADLLVIGDGLEVAAELSLQELAHTMRQSLVVDAASCFPAQEAQLFCKGYRAVGEKTNVWE
ncbi:hypothetical protein [Brevibacillus agri]|uniref:hypothetical protein n=1 Tax=Brevibacillus agri TaxID=51101 RepID=UPI0024BFC869|nr:hypothetical protein [Brevibacillus agri]MED4568334.1 hypothetical protein [Brevibacillus agri]WHX30804.1 hypothetical protein QNK09_00510 [Brevibacillus agri]